MPPDVREWLPESHPALFLLDVVENLDLSAFVAASQTTRERGRPAYHPQVMVGIVLYASMIGVTSSRRIEAALSTDVGFRVVAANERPDHVTICRFLVRHGVELQGVFGQVVGLAAHAGLVDPTVVAVDGTKMAGNASKSRNVTRGELEDRFAAWADTIAANDQADDEREADGGGGPIPEMTDPVKRREWVREQMARNTRGADVDAADGGGRVNLTDPESGLLPRSGGGWVQGYNAQAAAVEGGIVIAADVTANPADSTMLASMAATIEDAAFAACGSRPAVIVADAGYWNGPVIDDINSDVERADVLVATGQRLPDGPPEPLTEPDLAAYHEAVAVHDTAVAVEQQRRVAIIERVEAGELLLREAAEELGLSVPRTCTLRLAFRAGGIDAMTKPRLAGRPPRPPGPTRAAKTRHDLDERLARPAGRSLYRQRQSIIEPVFGDIKTNRRIMRFWRRGQDRIRTEWHWILTGHNLTILHRAT